MTNSSYKTLHRKLHACAWTPISISSNYKDWTPISSIFPLTIKTLLTLRIKEQQRQKCQTIALKNYIPLKYYTCCVFLIIDNLYVPSCNIPFLMNLYEDVLKWLHDWCEKMLFLYLQQKQTNKKKHICVSYFYPTSRLDFSLCQLLYIPAR